MVLWLWENTCHVLYLYIGVKLTIQGRGNSSEGTPKVLVEPPLYTGNDGRLQPACNSHQLTRRMIEPLKASETPAPLWSDRKKQSVEI